MREVYRNGAPVRFMDAECKTVFKQFVTVNYRKLEHRYKERVYRTFVYKYYKERDS
jgi:hypothetical protein